jgi:PilZ domain
MANGGIMDSNQIDKEMPERRSEKRSVDERYYSVQFTTEGLSSFYQFKLWNISAGGLCILVKEGSDILNHLTVGDALEMTYYLSDAQGASDTLKTKIIHITKNEDGRFQGHYLVGLSIL